MRRWRWRWVRVRYPQRITTIASLIVGVLVLAMAAGCTNNQVSASAESPAAARTVVVVQRIVITAIPAPTRTPRPTATPPGTTLDPLPKEAEKHPPSATSTPAPTPPPSPTPTATPVPTPVVHSIYAIPSDRTQNAQYEQAIGEALESVQNWYSEELAGVTFTISEPLPLICVLDEPSEVFIGEGGWNKVIESVQHCAPVAAFAEWDTWLIHIDVDFPCGQDKSFELGRAGSGIAILHGGDLQGLIADDGYQPCDYWGAWPSERWPGGLAHELTHAFGVSHPAECEVDPKCGDRSLMWHGFVDYPDTFLNDVDKAYITEFFSTPILRCNGINEAWCKHNW